MMNYTLVHANNAPAKSRIIFPGKASIPSNRKLLFRKIVYFYPQKWPRAKKGLLSTYFQFFEFRLIGKFRKKVSY